jgi:hypothetical protein
MPLLVFQTLFAKEMTPRRGFPRLPRDVFILDLYQENGKKWAQCPYFNYHRDWLSRPHFDYTHKYVSRLPMPCNGT